MAKKSIKEKEIIGLLQGEGFAKFGYLKNLLSGIKRQLNSLRV